MPVIASTQDLRSHAQDRKRERENKAKWSPKWGAVGIPVVKTGPGETVRPRQLRTQHQAIRDHQQREKATRKVHEQKKRPALTNDDETTPDTSADEELAEALASVDADTAYSFDAARSPAQGNEILEMAMTKAVARFEDQETTKLVKDEYEVLEVEHDEPCAHDSDDDFELL